MLGPTLGTQVLLSVPQVKMGKLEWGGGRHRYTPFVPGLGSHSFILLLLVWCPPAHPTPTMGPSTHLHGLHPAHHFVVDFMEVDLTHLLHDVLAFKRDKPEP